jgi:hypothetical protein
MISVTIASVVILVFVKRKDETIKEEVDTKSRASKKGIKLDLKIRFI